MKTVVNIFLVAGATFLLFNCGGGVTDAKEPGADSSGSSGKTTHSVPLNTLEFCVRFDLEDKICLDPYLKPYSEGRTQKADFNTYFSYFNSAAQPNAQLDQNPVKLNMNEIFRLHHELKDISANIKGVAIHMGLSGNKIVYLLRNVVLNCLGGETVVDNFYKYTPVEIGDTYVCMGDGTIEPISTSDFNGLCTNYAIKMRIKHKSGEAYTYRNYSPAHWKNDTEYIIFSYQELFYYYHLKDDCEGGKNEYEKPLWIHNGSALKGENDQKKVLKSEGCDLLLSEGEKVNKHTIFFSMIETLPAEEDPDEKAVLVTDLANLAHLCPPSCFPIFKIQEKRGPCLYP